MENVTDVKVFGLDQVNNTIQPLPIRNGALQVSNIYSQSQANALNNNLFRVNGNFGFSGNSISYTFLNALGSGKAVNILSTSIMPTSLNGVSGEYAFDYKLRNNFSTPSDPVKTPFNVFTGVVGAVPGLTVTNTSGVALPGGTIQIARPSSSLFIAPSGAPIFDGQFLPQINNNPVYIQPNQSLYLYFSTTGAGTASNWYIDITFTMIQL